ncbi:hypothetical protein LSAT2_001855 [Lamellibrachia satsuma]|nr:hypothetical protein LSAT2_001855 [Lamellibrachia satsuma]
MKRASKRITTFSDDNASCDAYGRFTRQKMFRSDHADKATDKCLFYDKPATRGNHLHEASTFDVDTRVILCACNLQYESLIAKLREGDFISIEAKYHGQCLTSLYNRDICRSRTLQDDDDASSVQNTAFTERISYIPTEL